MLLKVRSYLGAIVAVDMTVQEKAVVRAVIVADSDQILILGYMAFLNGGIHYFASGDVIIFLI